MPGRIALAGVPEAFVAKLDRFFGYGAAAVEQPGRSPSREAMAAGAALGLFPVAGQDLFLIGSPLFDRARLHLPGGHVFAISSENNGSEQQYVVSASLDGVPLSAPSLRWADLARGASLTLTMAGAPRA